MLRQRVQEPGRPELEAGRRPTDRGQLIEAAGLKGLRIGGAQVSPMHANYFVNTGDATAADVRALIEHAQQREVEERFGVRLEPEVKTGDPASPRASDVPSGEYGRVVDQASDARLLRPRIQLRRRRRRHRRGTKIWHFCHVMPGAVIGERCNLGQNVVVMAGTRLGNNVKVQNNVSIYEGVTLEDDVFCGPSCVFTNVINPRSHVSRKSEYRATLVRRGATIGANATIVCGVTLGEYSFIGAGAVVTERRAGLRPDGRRAGPPGRLDVPVRRPARARGRVPPPAPPAGPATAKTAGHSARLTHPRPRG